MNLKTSLSYMLLSLLLVAAKCDESKSESSELEQLKSQVKDLEDDKNKVLADKEQLKKKLDDTIKAKDKVDQDKGKAVAEQEQIQAKLNTAVLDQTKLNQKLATINQSESLLSQPVDEKEFVATLNANPKIPKNKPKNVIMVFIDTLRKDHVNNANAPEMTSFMNQGWSFNHSYSSSVATLPASFALFYSQNIHLRSPYLNRFWDGGSPFLRSLKALGYQINIWGSPWQYCIEGSHPILNDSYDTRNGAVSNLYLLYGKTPLDLIGRPGDALKGHCYKFFDYDPSNPLVKRDPYAYSQDFPNIPYKAKSWDTYVGDFNPNASGQHKEYYHQAYLDHKIVSDAINKMNTAGPAELNFHLVYLFSVHDPFAWLDKGYPDKIGPGSSDNILGIPTYQNSGPEYNDYLPWKNRIQESFGDIGHAKGQLPSYHTPWYSEYAKKIHGEQNDPYSAAQTNAAKERFKRMYKNAVIGADYQFHRLIKSLKDKGIYDDALIILVADHGKYLFETNLQNLNNAIKPPDGELQHFGPPLKQNTEIPMAFKFPKDKDPRIDVPIKVKNIGSHLDIFPTVIDYLSPDLYKDLREKRLIAGKSIIAHDRTCLVTEQPYYDEVNDFVMNNGQEKLFARFSDMTKPTLERKDFFALGFLDQNDVPIKIKDNFAYELTPFLQRAVARERFSECMEELFPLYGTTAMTTLSEDAIKYEANRQISRISMLPTLADKMRELNKLPGEIVRSLWTGNSMLSGPIDANYHFLAPVDRVAVKNYFSHFAYSFDPANPTIYNPYNDFVEIDPKDAANKSLYNLDQYCQESNEIAGSLNDVQRAYIPSRIENNIIKGNQYNVFANNIFFKTHNYQNMVPLYFDKLEKNKRVVAYGFTGSAQWPYNMLLNGLSRYPGAVTGKNTNIDLLNYYGGVESGTLAGFFSATRSVNIAKHFAQNNVTAPGAGTVYALLLEGAIMDPDIKSVGYKAYEKDNKDPAMPLVSQYAEQELAMADDVARWKIVAFRMMNTKGSAKEKKFDQSQKIYVRKGLDIADPTALRRIIRALAGCQNY